MKNHLAHYLVASDLYDLTRLWLPEDLRVVVLRRGEDRLTCA